MTALPPLALGPVTLAAPVVLAPMSGVTDRPFRAAARRCGAGLVVSEMIASRAVVEMSRHRLGGEARKLDDDPSAEFPISVQLAGCEPAVMAEAARIQAGRGAAIIDINFGCPAKKVTANQTAGAALMRDERQAARILDAVVAAVDVPVTLKMRLGWDDRQRNAAGLARIAAESGIRLLAVHGRTRQQFYCGAADWAAVRAVVDATALPVLVNGDIVDLASARAALASSGAAGVMVGRAAVGRPWLPGAIGAGLREGADAMATPPLEVRCALLLDLHEAVIAHYGASIGVRVARKHVATALGDLDGVADLRARALVEPDPAATRGLIADAFAAAVAGIGGGGRRTPAAPLRPAA